MIDNKLYAIVSKLVKESSQKKQRKIVSNLSASIYSPPPIKVLRGLRGIGKTTALLQTLSTFCLNQEGFYFSADWPQIKVSTLYNYAVELIENGKQILFIDEIHTYPDWENQLKAITDQFPDTRLLVSGSAPVVFRGDRRQKIYDWHPLTFSEYLYLKHDVQLIADEEWKSSAESATLISPYYPHIEGWFKEYTNIGGFPFPLEYSNHDSIHTIYTVLKQSLEKDAVTILKLSSQKIMAMERLLFFIATSSPGEMSINSLSRNLGISKVNVEEIIDALEQMKILRVLKPDASGASLVRGEPKILFSHPNLRASLCEKLGIKTDTGSLREELALFGLEQRGYHVFTIKGYKKNPDYVIRKGNTSTYIEIGGEGKDKTQLRGLTNSLLIKGNQLMTILLV